MERAKKLADLRAKETGKTHYVIMGPDEKPLVLNSQVARVLKKRHLMHKDTFLPREAVYIASF
ncbi:MAG: hypothetical protein IPH88_18350 [Bacteroidales bacterium]|nr:hypothetical protein [Bacteroidales bacterium]